MYAPKMRYPNEEGYPQNERPGEPNPSAPVPNVPVAPESMAAGYDENGMSEDYGSDSDGMGMGDDYGGGSIVAQMTAGLSKLAPEELQLLDSMITPEIGQLLTKAFGPEFGQIIAPLMQPEAPAISNFKADGGF